MIRPLRQYHRHTFVALAMLLPGAFALSITARRVVPENAPLPVALAATSHPFDRTLWTRPGLFSHAGIQVQLRHAAADTGKLAVIFSAPANFVQPDLLVYWTPGNSTDRERLPADAVLLGSFNAVVLPLPGVVGSAAGRLILYSLAHGEVVDVSQPISLRTDRPSQP